MKQARTFKDFLFLVKAPLRAILLVILIVKPKILILLSHLQSSPRRERILIRSGDKSFLSFRYSKRQSAKRPTFIIFRGFSAHRANYGMLNNLAQGLALLDYHVYVPILDDIKDYFLCTDSLLDMKKIISGVAKMDNVDTTQVGLIGESFSAGLSLLAVEDEEIKKLVRFVLLFSPYANLESTFQFAFSGKILVKGKIKHVRPDPFVRILYALNVLQKNDDTLDKKTLTKVFYNFLNERRRWSLDDLRNLGRDEQEFFLTVYREADRDKVLLQKLLSHISEYRTLLAPQDIRTDLKRPILIVHGIADDVVDYGQSVALADSLISSGGIILHLSNLYKHQNFTSFISNPGRWCTGVFHLSKVFFRAFVYLHSYELIKPYLPALQRELAGQPAPRCAGLAGEQASLPTTPFRKRI